MTTLAEFGAPGALVEPTTFRIERRLPGSPELPGRPVRRGGVR